MELVKIHVLLDESVCVLLAIATKVPPEHIHRQELRGEDIVVSSGQVIGTIHILFSVLGVLMILVVCR